MNQTRFFFITATTLAAVSIFFAYDPIHIFTPGPIPGAHDTLHQSDVIQLIGAFGPESLVFDLNGEGPYAGVADGRILKWQGEEHGWIEFAVTSPAQRKECARPFAPEMEHICGRPLGLRFHHKTGDLYIADAYFGLLRVGPNGGLATQILAEAENEPFIFTNDLDIDEDEDVIYFTDTSTAFQRREFIPSLLTRDKTGRLMKYNIQTKQVEVLLRNLSFANGVALNEDRSFLLLAETSTCKILRYWLQGPKSGTSDTFAVLPGFPDNIRRNPKGEFWVALHSKKGKATNWILSFDTNMFGKFLLKLPLSFKQLHYLIVGGKPHASVVKLSEQGRVVEVLEDGEGKGLRFVSEAEERDGELWVGSVMMPFVGRYKLVA